MSEPPECLSREKLRAIRMSMRRRQIDALLLSQPANIRYVTGFSSSTDGMALVTPENVVLFTDFRYEVQAAEECCCEVIIWKGRNRFSYVRSIIKEIRCKVLGVEQDSITIALHDRISRSTSVKIRPTSGIIEKARRTKTPWEVKRIRHAARINDQAFMHILTVIKPGLTEIDLALELEWYLRKHTSHTVAFDLIVAAGPNGAKPHATPTNRKIARGDLITLDFGARWDGYCSDMTRTVAVGAPSSQLKKIYNVVRRAQAAGLKAIRPAIKAKQADKAAREIIEKEGFGRYFGHGLGHGVGLEIHEGPRLSPYSNETLRPGMVVTCEPGIYIPGLGGVRIEDIVLVTEKGARRLSSAPKKLICL